MNNFNLPSIFEEMAIGFDDIFERLNRMSLVSNTNYPPYNIAKLDNNRYEIELALAGFTDDEIEVTKTENALIIAGVKKSTSKSDEKKQYVHYGISSRKFTRTFGLADTVEVESCVFDDGILRVVLKNNVPGPSVETIKIEKPKQLLTEENKS